MQQLKQKHNPRLAKYCKNNECTKYGYKFDEKKGKK